jgi:hypothetical protein
MLTYVEHPCNQMQHWRIKAQHERLLELCTKMLRVDDMNRIQMFRAVIEAKSCNDGYSTKPIYVVLCNFNQILINILNSLDQHGDLISK